MPDMAIRQHDSTRIDGAVEALRRGEAVGLPTETVYGLAADARNREAIARVFALKGRPLHHPLIVHLPAALPLIEWAADVPAAAYRLAEAFWPGPLTLVLRRHPAVLDAVTGGQSTIALRVPAHPVAQAVLQAFGDGLVAPSANRFGHLSPTTAAHVRNEFGDALPVVLDGGACTVGVESSIVDLSGATPRLLRPGMLAPGAIEDVLGARLARDMDPDSPRVPGSLESHYAPRTPTHWVEVSRRYPNVDSAMHAGAEALGRPRVAVLAHGEMPTGWTGVAMPRDPDAYATQMYAALRELDAGGFAALLVEAPPDEEAWLAIRDRLRRACAR